jgi:tRNA A-37 threonylcarbamoyl transferase component Bud32
MLTTGTVLQDRYRVVSLLGEGGMGAVYRAWDTRLNVPVALKEMTPQPGLDPQMLAQLRQQFRQEAEVLARLNHPHLVRVTDFFEERGNTYLVMDFVEGESLADRIVRRGPLPEAEVLASAGQLLSALAYCHTRGVIHRDIKPQNVIIQPDGRAVLVDFGLVKLWDPHDPRTKTAMRGMGTPEYAPPEQYETDIGHTDARSDVYSMGAMLYHALAGQAPPTATLRMAAPERFVPVRELNPRVSPSTETAILRAMELARSQRWQSAGEMAEALGVSSPLAPTQPAGRGALATPRGGKTMAIPGAQPRAPTRRRVPVWAWALGGLAVLLVCLAMVGLRGLVVRRARVAATAQAQEQAQVTATAQSQMTSTAQAQKIATAQIVRATATAQAQATAAAQAAHATATAQIHTIATAQTARATATAEARAAATAAASGGDPLVAASRWPVVLSDSFSANENDWPAGDYSDERVAGNRLIANGKYRWEATALDDVIWWSIPEAASVSDFYLTAEARRVSGVEDGQYGVIFRRADRDNYGLFKIEDSQYFKVSLQYEGEWDTVIDWTKSSTIRPDGVNRLTVVGRGSHLTFYINDEYVGEADESRLSGGKTGVAIELVAADDSAVFEFDNFEVRAP